MKAFNKLEKKKIDPVSNSEKVPMEADLRTKIETHLKEIKTRK